MNPIVYVIIKVIFAYIIAIFFGKKKQIGFWFSFILIILIPIVGLINVYLSKSINELSPQPSKLLKVSGAIILIIGMGSSISAFFKIIYFDSEYPILYGDLINIQVWSIGLFVLGIYLYNLGLGKRFN